MENYKNEILALRKELSQRINNLTYLCDLISQFRKNISSEKFLQVLDSIDYKKYGLPYNILENHYNHDGFKLDEDTYDYLKLKRKIIYFFDNLDVPGDAHDDRCDNLAYAITEESIRKLDIIKYIKDILLEKFNIKTLSSRDQD